MFTSVITVHRLTIQKLVNISGDLSQRDLCKISKSKVKSILPCIRRSQFAKTTGAFAYARKEKPTEKRKRLKIQSFVFLRV